MVTLGTICDILAAVQYADLLFSNIISAMGDAGIGTLGMCHSFQAILFLTLLCRASVKVME